MSKMPERTKESRGRELTTEIMKEIPRLLRADAAGKRGANAILWNAAADELERMEKENRQLAKIVDGIESLVENNGQVTIGRSSEGAFTMMHRMRFYSGQTLFAALDAAKGE